MPGLSRGFHFWQPAPRLNNTPMAGRTPQPSHEPPRKGTGTRTLTGECKKLKRGRGQKTSVQKSWRLMLQKSLMLPKTQL